MTKNKDIYNVSYSGTAYYSNTTGDHNTSYSSKTEKEEEDLFMQAVRQQHEAVLESEKQYLAKQKKNQEKYARGEKIFPDSVVSQIVKEHLDRAGKGFIKYNETLDRTDLSLVEWLQHTKEELMDAVLYIEKTIQVLKGNDKV